MKIHMYLKILPYTSTENVKKHKTKTSYFKKPKTRYAYILIYTLCNNHMCSIFKKAEAKTMVQCCSLVSMQETSTFMK
jgi:hypothetical protein